MREAVTSDHGTEEKAITQPQTQAVLGNNDSAEQRHPRGIAQLWSKISSLLSIEEQGNEPIPIHQKNDRRYWKLFTLWFSMNFNLIP
jgi:hypothetical protein